MPPGCRAYFITFGCYGCWLHGDQRGSVDRDHNQYEAPLVEPCPERVRAEAATLTQPPYLLDEERRELALAGILNVVRKRGWAALAIHVRSNHIHAVICAKEEPIERVMNDLKAFASRHLNRRFPEEADRKRWARHGSTDYLWTDESVAGTVHYVLHSQGRPLARYPTADDVSSEPRT